MQPNTQPAVPLNVLQAQLVIAQYRLTQITSASITQTEQCNKQIEGLQKQIAATTPVTP